MGMIGVGDEAWWAVGGCLMESAVMDEKYYMGLVGVASVGSKPWNVCLRTRVRQVDGWLG